ncbi:2Fe-2S iron-sulfur cluster binding domain-containing protein [Legionella israelensis]|uniref:2Fe-2S iron-sulfur cluster binding domain-containing protein n=1 Tax=Legionella israelensis TaxID=454 RepID=A0AAX1EIK6_9GAMM|nr:FAD-binding oxidoreductase [Legionella israelensis]QBR84795.1 2Fe-2S iron-sulfur cluster binding domain-containing protein [Legionella israelensis]
MAELHYNQLILQSIEDESVLDCLLRHDVDYPNSCRSGVCQACLIKTTDTPIEPKWQEGLPETLKSQGYFLACQAKPMSTLHLKNPDAAECEQQVMITEITPLTHNVIRVKLLAEHLENWIPGQYLNLLNPEGISRSYSIANMPEKEGYIELHIKLKDDGAMSQWFRKKATVDTMVHIRGPFGKCYYMNPDQSSFNILLAGTGTGLASLLGIVKTALSKQHQGKIILIHGGCQDDDIYYAEELETLASFYQNFQYVPCVLKSNGCYQESDIAQQLLIQLNNTDSVQVYVCGPKETTNKLKTKAFLAGVPSSKIYSDAFL